MSLAIISVRPEDIKGFINREGRTVTEREAAEAWAAYLTISGGSGSRLPELEFTWLGARGAVGENLRDRWGSYLDQNGYTGNFQDQMRVFFSSGSVVGTPASDYLLESNSFIVLESGTTNQLLLEA